LHKLDLAGNVLAKIPVVAHSVCVEPDTGYIWTIGRRSIDRLDRDGRIVQTLPGKTESSKAACLVVAP
jgi:hypothetical protein